MICETTFVGTKCPHKYIYMYIYIYVVVVYASNAFSFFLRFQNQGLNEGLRLRLG